MTKNNNTASTSDLRLSRRMLMTGLGTSIALSGCQTTGQAGDILSGILNTGGAGALSQADAASGIRAALNNGIGSAISTIGVQNGFLNNNLIKIPLPGFLQDAQSSLSRLGLSGPLDSLETQLNRGAEAAVPVARDIFVDAVSGLTIQDAIGIVQGGENAATTLLRERTGGQLSNLFTPIMTNALQQAGAIQTFDQLSSRLNSIPLAPNLGADAKTKLISHGVDRGLDGMFTYIGREEAAIRANPAARTSEILQRVFG